MSSRTITLDFGQVQLKSDLFKKLMVLSDLGWVPFSSGTPEERATVRDMVIGHPNEKLMTESMRFALSQ